MNPTVFLRRLLLVSLLGTLMITLGSCNRSSSSGFGNIDIRTPVEVQSVRLGDIETLVVATGTLQPQESATVNAQIQGRVFYERGTNGERYFEGHQVKRGDILARIAGEEAELNLDLAAKKESFEIAETEYNRQVRLHEEGIITDSVFESTRQTYLNAKNVYERALLDERNTKVIAPMDGSILRLPRNEQNILVADETLVGAGQLVAEIADLTVLEAYIDLISTQWEKVLVGQEVRVKPSATYDDLSFSGTLKRKLPTMNKQNHTFQIVVEVPNDELLLNPNSFVEVEIIIEQRLQVPVVSLDSVKKSRNNNDVVFVVEGQRVQERRVRLGLQDDERVEILEGLDPGERVVFGGVQHLQDGRTVSVVREL